MTNVVSWFPRLTAAVLCLMALGCNSGELKTYDVPGKLVYDDGTPVNGATLVFQTKVGDKTVDGHAMADSEGRFRVTTFKEGDGIVEGEHAVSVSPLPAGDSATPTAPSVPPAYSDFSTSGLKTTVTPATQEIVITVSRSGT
jgi:hypothetical protein